MIINSQNILDESVTGQLIVSIINFADILTHLETWGLVKRYYEGDKSVVPIDGMFNRLVNIDGTLLIQEVCKPKLSKVYKELLSLDEVNDSFEYCIGIGKVDDKEVWRTISFTKQGNYIEFELY